MKDLFTMKIPKKIHDIFEDFVKKFPTVHSSGTEMIKDLIKTKAEELLKQLEKEKINE